MILISVKSVFAVVSDIKCEVTEVQSFTVVSCCLLEFLWQRINDDFLSLNRDSTAASYLQVKTQRSCPW